MKNLFVKINLHLDGATSVRQVPWVPTPFEYRLRSFTARISEEEKNYYSSYQNPKVRGSTSGRFFFYNSTSST